ncbi:TetR/AcrR family transcriptional regulator [Nocardioides caldifontis]|uniref:TetR/AcrR family transcriptional regulator n=1 Tax=Nocardioides caldifontis TaxID=2588938 RepID=UPI0011DFCDE2|nr:TetR-like C-terminal domain-containing protein [Nocardioides caldifontis]
MTATPVSRRERQRLATLDEIVRASRSLLREPGGLTLRAVAQKVGMTAPALYRYVDDYRALVRLITRDIDRETAALIRAARDSQPEDDPAARIICAGIAFRRWALANRAEFALVFANPSSTAEDHAEMMADEETAVVFHEMVWQLWQKHRFPLPDPASLDPLVLEIVEDPMIPGKLDGIPEEARTLTWLLIQSWARLYGTVTLEVFGHCDPRVIESASLFRSMLAGQAELFGITDELPRLAPLVEEWLAER